MSFRFEKDICNPHKTRRKKIEVILIFVFVFHNFTLIKMIQELSVK